MLTTRSQRLADGRELRLVWSERVRRGRRLRIFYVVIDERWVPGSLGNRTFAEAVYETIRGAALAASNNT